MEAIPSSRLSSELVLTKPHSESDPSEESDPKSNEPDRISWISESETAEDRKKYKAEQKANDRELEECVRDIARQEKEKKWLIVSFFLFLPALAGLGWLIYHTTTKQSSSKMQSFTSS
jgi:hypothetical protein